ncbi:MAG: TolC family protein [Planctomycetaceae bacterium]|nr:TolC family protein [Planctomycetaceae bacterium]
MRICGTTILLLFITGCRSASWTAADADPQVSSPVMSDVPTAVSHTDSADGADSVPLSVASSNGVTPNADGSADAAGSFVPVSFQPAISGLPDRSKSPDASAATAPAASDLSSENLSLSANTDDSRRSEAAGRTDSGSSGLPAFSDSESNGDTGAGITLTQVIDSVHSSYPLVEAAFRERDIANGNQLSAWGEFDTKLKAATENSPVGFYETYRNSAGIYKPLYGGGEIFGAYRIGDGSFEPWYKERETDEAGEFKAGVRVPLIRNRDIDARRAALWKATYDQQLADPVIQSRLIEFTREAGLAYWKWVASGQKVILGRRWLDVADKRSNAIRRRVELGDLDPPEEIDNRRAIAKREAKLADAVREFRQAAFKLSLFLRGENGNPYVPSSQELPPFPNLRTVAEDRLTQDVAVALQNRPELTALSFQYRQLQVDYAEACNQTLPGLDAQLIGAQDVGEPASKKRDKSQFELEAGVYFDVPVEKRKGRGKMHAVQSKLAQLSAKRRITEDKITAEVRAAYVGMIQTQQEALKARRAAELSVEMAEIEQRKFELGDSDLLKVALREQYALEAAEEEILATLNHFVAFTEYSATLALIRPTETLLQ